MNEVRSWSDTVAAQYRAALGYREEFRSAEQVASDLGAEVRTAATNPEVRNHMQAEVAALHRLVPMVVVPDTRSPIDIIADRTRVAAQTKIKTYTHAEIQAMAAQQWAKGPVVAVMRPGGPSGNLPHWTPGKGGNPWRSVAFTSETEQQAIDIAAAWQAEDLAHQMGERAELGKLGIGF